MSRKRLALLVACVLIFGGSVGGGGYLIAHTTKQTASSTQELAEEAAIRQRQFCRVLLSSHHDKEKRLRNTIEYLHTPAGHEPSAINEYIRAVSLPQTKKEVDKEAETLPTVCKKQEEEQ